jgi:hypothetical protein
MEPVISGQDLLGFAVVGIFEGQVVLQDVDQPRLGKDTADQRFQLRGAGILYLDPSRSILWRARLLISNAGDSAVRTLRSASSTAAAGRCGLSRSMAACKRPTRTTSV